MADRSRLGYLASVAQLTDGFHHFRVRHPGGISEERIDSIESLKAILETADEDEIVAF